MTIKNSDLIIIAVIILVILFLYYSQNKKEEFNTTLPRPPSILPRPPSMLYPLTPFALYIANRINNNNQLINMYSNDPNTNATITGKYDVININNFNNLPYIVGTTSTSIKFPNVLKDKYTVVAITKYNNNINNKGPILRDGLNNIYGHYQGKAGVVYFSNKLVTHPNLTSQIRAIGKKKVINPAVDPLVTCIRVTNDNNDNNIIINTDNNKKIYPYRHIDVLCNDMPIGRYNNHRTIKTDTTYTDLFINNNTSNDFNASNDFNTPSDFSFSLLCVFNKYLSDDEMRNIGFTFNRIVSTPRLIKSL
jgi:hypothetical protein